MTLNEAFWNERRQEVLLDNGSVYLNSGSFSPVPRGVFDRMTELRDRLARSPSDFFWRQTPPLLEAARDRLARFLGANRRQLLFCVNVTQALNIAVASLDLPAGSEILLSNHEYGAMRFLLRDSATKKGWALREVAIPLVPSDPDEIVSAFRSAVSPSTRVLFFSHVTSPTGLVMPAEKLCALAAERGLLSIVDGAHAAGMVDVNLETIGADFYGGNCHKWMMAPAGVGFLAVAQPWRAGCRPLVVSWGWDFDPDRPDDDSGWGGTFWQRNLEFAGTIDRCPTMVIPETLDFRARLGGEPAIRDRCRQLSNHLRRRLLEQGLPAATPTDPSLSGMLTAFSTPSVDPVRARDWMWQTHRIEAPFTSTAGMSFLRVSTAWFNTFQELDQLADAMKQFPFNKLQT